jgi:hypothetical protein
MKIYTIWSDQFISKGEMPVLVYAVDEYTIENNGDMPDEYKAKALHPCSKELIINIPEKKVRDLFEIPEVSGTTKE